MSLLNYMKQEKPEQRRCLRIAQIHEDENEMYWHRLQTSTLVYLLIDFEELNYCPCWGGWSHEMA